MLIYAITTYKFFISFFTKSILKIIKLIMTKRLKVHWLKIEKIEVVPEIRTKFSRDLRCVGQE